MCEPKADYAWHPSRAVSGFCLSVAALRWSVPPRLNMGALDFARVAEEEGRGVRALSY